MNGPREETGMTNRSVEETQDDAEARRAAGEFVRGQSRFRAVIGKNPRFPPEPGRYHLHVALNCPWCHRVTMARNCLGLRESVTLDVAFPNRTPEDDPAGPGLWEFAPHRVATLTGTTLPECTAETGTGEGLRLARQLYEAEGSEEKSLPILYDKRTGRIVSNESAEIVRMLAADAEALGSTLAEADRPELYPAADATLRAEIDALNERIYVRINNGAYKAGFSSDQATYAAAFERYFAELDALDTLLAEDDRPFLTGSRFTEADLRLFPTLFRHDPVYVVRMKLNGARILDYPHLWRWLCRVPRPARHRRERVSRALPAGILRRAGLSCTAGSWNGTVPLGPRRPMSYPEAYEHPELADRRCG